MQIAIFFAIEIMKFINSIAKTKLAIFDEKIEIKIRTKDIRLAVNSTKRNPGIVVVSQVYSRACHTAFILDRARG